MVELSSRPPRTQVGNGGINSSSKCIRERSFVRFPNFQFLMRPPVSVSALIPSFLRLFPSPNWICPSTRRATWNKGPMRHDAFLTHLTS